MNSRERVLSAVNHKQPDRIPNGVSFCPEVIDNIVNAGLFADSQAFWDWLELDFAWVGPGFNHSVSGIRYADPTIEVTDKGLYLDIYRVPFKVADTEFQTYVDIAGIPPLKDMGSPADLETFPWPTPDIWDYSGIESGQKKDAEKATECQSRGFFEIAHFMRGMDTFLMDLVLNPEMACAIMDHIIAHLYGRAERLLEAGKGQYAVFEYNDDVASQNGLFISPDMWRTYIKPRMARFTELYHSHGAKVRYHSCGSVREIIPDLIEIGVDILNPVQALAAGMDPAELKREYGSDLSFQGGVDIQDLLVNGSPDKVRDHVHRLVDVLGKDGGYILAGTHTIQADTPPDNVIAMVEAVRN